MRFFSRFAIVITAGLLSVSCASRITSDRYARWSEQDRIRRIESEREEKIRKEVERRMGKESPASSSTTNVPTLKAPVVSPTPTLVKPSSTATSEPESTPSIPIAPVVKTPRAKTATASRAVKPIFREMQDEEEAIY